MKVLHWRFAVAVALLTIGALGLAGCPWNTERASDTVDKTLPFSPGDLLSLHAENGQVSIRGGNSSQMRMSADIKVEIFQHAPPARLREMAQDLLDQVEIRVVAQSVGVSIETVSPETSFPPEAVVTVDYDIEIPEKAGIRVESGNGDVGIDGTEGSVDVDLGNGDISLTGIQGNLDVRLGNGSVHAIETAGTLDAEVGNGEFSVSHSAPLLPEDQWTIEVGNGGVKASLNKASAFAIDARTSVGNIDKGCFLFDVDNKWPGLGEEAQDQEGEGGGTIDIRVGNGDIEFNCL